MKNLLEIKNLSVTACGKKLLKGINLKVESGQIHVLMGPNGAGKTSLAMALAGNPHYQILAGQINLNRKNLGKLTPDQRANLGLFITFQKPVEIPGISARNILRFRLKSDFEGKLNQVISDLKINEELVNRSLENFSGGEGKKLEMLQAEMLLPKFLILDEVDSGLDVDALKLVSEKIQQMAQNGAGILLITHNPRILKYLKFGSLHVIIQGKIVQTDGPKILEAIERKGYEGFK